MNHFYYIGFRRVHMTPNQYIEDYGYHNMSGIAIDYINDIERSNAIIMPTMGVWFNSRYEYEEELRIELDYFSTLAKRENVKNKILWLAAWPQHFNTTEGNGYYSIGSHSEYSCVPHSINHDDWRNDILQRVASAYYPHIELFYNDLHFMNEMWDMHSFPRAHDCTHWCYHPLYMLPLWHMLGKLLDDFPLL